MVTERVDVIATFTQKGLKAFKKNIDGWNAAMGAPLSRMKEVQTAQGGWNKKTQEGRTAMGRAALGIRKATHGMRGFRMEMLGLMFFGMSMQRMFGGLMKTALEWAGTMDILSMTLGVVFLPVVLQLTEALIPISSWFMNLSDTTKLWIGWIVVLGFVIGTAIMIIGQLALGIGSLILVFGGFSVSSILLGLGTLLIAIAAITGAILVLRGMFGGFDKDFDDSVANFQRNGGFMAKTMGSIVRIFTLGGAIIGATFMNAISLILIAFYNMARDVNIIITTIINSLIKAWNWFKKVKAMGGYYNETALMKSTSGHFDTKIAAETQKIAERSVPLILGTPTAGDLFTGGSDSGQSGSVSITNNYNGFSNEDLLREIDSRDREMAAQMERNR